MGGNLSNKLKLIDVCWPPGPQGIILCGDDGNILPDIFPVTATIPFSVRKAKVSWVFQLYAVSLHTKY